MLAAVVRNHSEALVVLDEAGRVVFANDAVTTTGWRPEELIGRDGLDLLHPEDLARATAALTASAETARPAPGLVRIVGPDGEFRRFEVSPGAARLDDGRTVSFATMHDSRLNTAHWETLSALLSGASTADALDVMAHGVSNDTDGPMGIAFDDGGRRHHVGPLPPALVGVLPDGTVDLRPGSPFAEAVATGVATALDLVGLPEDVAAAARAAGLRHLVVVGVPDPGARHPGLIAQWPPTPAMADLLAASLVRRPFELVTLAVERRHQQDRLEWLAWHDQLTGLVNRAGFLDAAAEAAAGEGGMICYLDLDGFKEVNDTHGHVVGDRLLEVCAERLRAAARREDVVARLGGDEFAVLCHHPLRPDHAAHLGARLVATLDAPVAVAGLTLEVGVSVGIAMLPAGSTPDAAISAADHALYEVKRSGKGRWHAATT
jgi:diguanylate cyclase (GGDEF)-like protein/PAS domain S-box-containing protein